MLALCRGHLGPVSGFGTSVDACPEVFLRKIQLVRLADKTQKRINGGSCQNAIWHPLTESPDSQKSLPLSLGQGSGYLGTCHVYCLKNPQAACRGPPRR